jgi:pimeloyl-ACP methyl ester carboxylesterase
MREFWQGGWRRPESTVEHIDMVESISQARGIRSLGALPLHVLTAGTCLNDPHIPPAHRQHMQDRWDALQKSFLQLSSAATQSFVKHSGHFIQRDDPQAIVDVIRAMAAA